MSSYKLHKFKGKLKAMLNADEEINELHIEGLRIIQNKKKFCYGIDAVLLSWFADARHNDRIVDLGTGTGIIPILMTESTKAADFTALEIQSESADMARRSVILNNLESKIKIIEGDIKYVHELFAPNSFNVVTCNPPYMNPVTGTQNSSDTLAIARHEILCNLEDVIKAASYLMKSPGKFFLVHRPARLAEIFSLMHKYKMEPKRMQLVQPAAGKAADIVLIEARKGAKPELKIEPVLSVYEKPGIFSAEINNIYRRK